MYTQASTCRVSKRQLLVKLVHLDPATIKVSQCSIPNKHQSSQKVTVSWMGNPETCASMTQRNHHENRLVHAIHKKGLGKWGCCSVEKFRAAIWTWSLQASSHPNFPKTWLRVLFHVIFSTLYYPHGLLSIMPHQRTLDFSPSISDNLQLLCLVACLPPDFQFITALLALCIQEPHPFVYISSTAL